MRSLIATGRQLVQDLEEIKGFNAIIQFAPTSVSMSNDHHLSFRALKSPVTIIEAQLEVRALSMLAEKVFKKYSNSVTLCR